MSLEVLAPAGNKHAFFAAVNAGADAIYLGLEEFSARGSAENFSLDKLSYYLNYAHCFGVKVYIAVNTLIKNDELERFFSFIARAYGQGADAFIIQDIFLGKELKRLFPEIVLHLSTQAGTCNSLGAHLAKELGFDRVILARETDYNQIKEICKIIETEVFVQGAMCSSFSGHCYLSSFVGGMSGNRGLCKQPCRKRYTYSGEGFDSFEGYNMSLKDLCLVDELNALIDAGVSSIKIEGRMRSPEYVWSAVNAYKQVGNHADAMSKLKRSFNRGDYTKGYFYSNSRGIISDKIQGNIGENIGKITKIYNDVASLKTNENFSSGDGFKIINKGREVGSGVYYSQQNNVLSIKFSGKCIVGCDVHITKDESLSKQVLSLEKRLPVDVSIAFEENHPAVAKLTSGMHSICVKSDCIFEAAVKSSLTNEDVVECFNKTDDYPFDINITVRAGNVFAPKSLLNAFRRKCYLEFFNSFTKKPDVMCSYKLPIFEHTPDVKCCKNAYILTDNTLLCKINNSIVIYRPEDYSDHYELNEFLSHAGDNLKYLYLPPFANDRDIEIISDVLAWFDGIYCEGYYGLLLAKLTNKKLFCGTGFNLYNNIDILMLNRILPNGFDYAYSKELSSVEIDGMMGGGYVFSNGRIQVMDNIYCPFGNDCSRCNKGYRFSLRDEDNREYIVRRYKLSSCRFELYNPYDLIANKHFLNNLFDFTLMDASMVDCYLEGSDDKRIMSKNYTYGNLKRGVK